MVFNKRVVINRGAWKQDTVSLSVRGVGTMRPDGLWVSGSDGLMTI